MIHASNWKPRVFPIYSDTADTEIDRVQDLSSTATLNRTKVEEVGRDGAIDYRKSTPTVSVTMRQLEYGNIEFFRQIANKGLSVDTIAWTDFRTSAFDIAGYMTDDSGTFLGTIWYPALRVAGFTLNIGAPDAQIERNFTFNGEDEVALLNNNKYFIHGRYVIASTGNNQTVTIASPTPTADPDNSGRYLFRVTKENAGTTTELTHGTQWSYNGAGTLTINGSSTAGDIIWVWYSGSTQGNQTIFSNNNTDVASIDADSCTILLQSSTTVSRLQSVSIETTFDRRDIREIGNKDIVARGVREITNRITLGRILETYTIEEFLRGKANASYGKISSQQLLSGNTLIVKIYNSNLKTTFKMGYKFSGLAPTALDASTPVADYANSGNTLEGSDAWVTTAENLLF